jgi:hypothetical protein
MNVFISENRHFPYREREQLAETGVASNGWVVAEVGMGAGKPQ